MNHFLDKDLMIGCNCGLDLCILLNSS